MASLKSNIGHGDIQRIVDKSNISYATVNKWLKSEEYRKTIKPETGASIATAYQEVIRENIAIRDSNQNIINEVEHELNNH